MFFSEISESLSRTKDGINIGGGPSSSSKPQEPNIDFKLDVKVFINSGKCVLHTKDPAKEDEIKL